MVDLRTRYLGLDLRNPLIASASPLSDHLETLELLESSGAAAVVMRSLFEEQIEQETFDLHELMEQWTESCFEATSFFPPMKEYRSGPNSYLEGISAAKSRLSIPVIGSLNGVSPHGWTRYAKLIEEAGADALELNVYFVAADPEETSASVEQRYLDLVADVRSSIAIPLAVKISAYFSALPAMARSLVAAGADGLVLFNRFMQPDIDLESLTVVPTVKLSSPNELTLRLRWIAILRGVVGDASLAATGGVHRGQDVLKALLAGADATMMASALLRNGPEYIATVLADVEAWLEMHEYESVEQLKGSLSQHGAPDPAAFERSQYRKAITSYASPFASMPRGNWPPLLPLT